MSDWIGDKMVALGPGIAETIERAIAGDGFAWGELYGQAGALISAGNPLPEPLASVIAARLAALSQALTARPLLDLRARLPNAVAPAPRLRRSGPKAAPVARAERAAEAALDMLEVDASRGRRVRVIERVAAVVGCTSAEVEKAMASERKRRGFSKP